MGKREARLGDCVETARDECGLKGRRNGGENGDGACLARMD
jgi:hypothetical protein